MYRLPRVCLASPFRFYSTTPQKSIIELVKQLRVATDAPLTKARQALKETGNDYDAALEWLEKELMESGAAKAERIKGRKSSQGLLYTHVESPGYPKTSSFSGAIVELNSESDFVARTDQFAQVAADIAHSAIVYAEAAKTLVTSFDLETFLQKQIIQRTESKTSVTIEEVIANLIARTGENITLRRVTAISDKSPSGRLASYSHNGRIASLALLNLCSTSLLPTSPEFFEQLDNLELGVARQIVGFHTTAITSDTNNAEPETILYNQQADLFPGNHQNHTVGDVVKELETKWDVGISIPTFVKWELGEMS